MTLCGFVAVAYSLVSVILLSSCDATPGTAGAGGAFIRWDSAGVTIAENEASSARRAARLVLDSAPALRIGRMDGDDLAYLFDGITGVREFSDGRIMVLNGGSQAVRFFDSDGRFLHEVGREGEGPGEYIWPYLALSPASDSIKIYDRRSDRLTTLGPQGEFVDVDPVPTMVGFTAIGAIDGHLLSYYSITKMVSCPGGTVTEPSNFWIFDREDETNTPIGSFPGRDKFITCAFGPERYGLNIPYDIHPSATVGKEVIYATAGEGPEILAFDLDGALVRKIRLDSPPEPVSDEDFEAFVRLHAPRVARDEAAISVIEDVYMEMPRPDVKPEFSDLLVADDGALWARLYDVDELNPPEWMVFDPEGRSLGTVQLPAGLEVYQIGEDFVLGVETDDLGVEYVVRYNLVERTDAL